MKFVPLNKMNLWTIEESPMYMVVKINDGVTQGPKDWWEYIEMRQQLVWIVVNDLLENYEDDELAWEVRDLEDSWRRSSSNFGMESFPHPSQLLDNRKKLLANPSELRVITDQMTYDEMSPATIRWREGVEEELAQGTPVLGGPAVLEALGGEPTLLSLLTDGGMWL